MKPFIPEKMPPKNIKWEDLIPLMSKAQDAVARYDGMLHGMINPNVLLSPLTLQEAVLSSKIEGTQATLGEVLQHEAGERYDEIKSADIKEIINYRLAMMTAENSLKKLPISLNMIKKMHAILLKGVRGEKKARGEFRKVQNWIGQKGCSMEEADYVPPEPIRLMEFLDDWEKYFHKDEKNLLVQLAIVHAQFEIIHPFIDGNGRIGRILIPLFLFENKLLSRPVFYISSYLDIYRDKYYSSLNKISRSGDWMGWIRFFLNAVISQASDNIKKSQGIQTLYEKTKVAVARKIKTTYAIEVLDFIFSKPVFSSTDFFNSTSIPKRTGLRLIVSLKELKILRSIKPSKGSRPEILAFGALLELTEGKKIV